MAAPVGAEALIAALPGLDEPALLGLLASTDGYDANHGDPLGGRLWVEVGEQAAAELAARGAVDALRGALIDPAPEVRARAAHAIGRIGAADDATLGLLRAALADAPPVAVAAARALGGALRGDPRLQPMVRDALARPEARHGALVLAQDLDSPDVVALADALFALVDEHPGAWPLICDQPGLDARALALVVDRAAGHPGARWQAVRLLRERLQRRRDAPEPLLAALRDLLADPEPWIRDEAASIPPYSWKLAGA